MATSKNTSTNSSAPTFSPFSPAIIPSLNSSTAIDFPFNFLHAEMVGHFKKRDAEIAEKKAEWLEHVKDSDFAEALVSGQHKDGQQVASQIFAHGNADTRLESIGYRVGYVLVERIAKDVPRLTSELETMKFICKEFWTTVFGKAVDNLRTNHQGIYIIQDNQFYTVASFSEGTQYLEESVIFLAFPSGVVRGALENLGISALVTAQVEKLPIVKFNISLNK